MQLINKLLLYLFLVLIASSCIDPFEPKEIDYEPMLFIKAIVTDDPDIPAMVELSNTSPLSREISDLPLFVEISGAVVYMEKDDETRYYFSENISFGGWGAGKYYLTDGLMELTEGSWYRLIVETTDGYKFESDFEEYLTSPAVGDIKYRYEKLALYQDGVERDGYQFTVSTTSSGDKPGYYRWDLDETYRYYVPLLGVYYWNGVSLIDSMSWHLSYCYKDDKIDGIFVGSTAGLVENRVVDAPLHFVSGFGDRLQIEYSLHVRQYRITPGAFQFWSDLRTLLYETGGLYETQPFRVSGNIHCVSEPPVNVAGIFEVAGVAESRIFVPRPTEFVVITNICIPDTVGTPDYPWDKVPYGSWIMENDPGLFTTSDIQCFDCTTKGGYLAKPPFWEK